MFLFAVHTYHFVNKKINSTIDFLPGLHTRIWTLDGNLNRCSACVFRDNPSVSFIWWLRSAECFTKIHDSEMIRMALTESLNALKKNEIVSVADLNEVNNLISDINSEDFRHEIKAINEELERLTKKTT